MKINSLNVVTPLQLEKVDPQLVAAAKGMEANFLRQMVRTMRSSVPENEETQNNQALQLFRGMLDDHYAEAAAENNGIGIAELIIRHLTGQNPITVQSESLGKTEKN